MFLDNEDVKEAFLLPSGLPRHDDPRRRSRLRRYVDMTRYRMMEKTTHGADNMILGSTLPPPKILKGQICAIRANMLREAGYVFPKETRHGDGNCAET